MSSMSTAKSISISTLIISTVVMSSMMFLRLLNGVKTTIASCVSSLWLRALNIMRGLILVRTCNVYIDRVGAQIHYVRIYEYVFVIKPRHQMNELVYDSTFALVCYVIACIEIQRLTSAIKDCIDKSIYYTCLHLLDLDIVSACSDRL